MKKAIFSPKAPKPIGAYSQAVLLDNTLYISGMIGMDIEGNLQKDIVSQTEQILKNISYILQEAGFSKKDIVKVNIYITHLENFAIVNSIYEKFLEDVEIKPARATIEVSGLPKGALIEIDAIAIKD